MTDAQYEAKFKEMQKYVPFLQKVIEKLKVNNEQQAENPRKAQLQKMEMLHELLTNKAKKIKMETLIKCEGVLIKLHAKIEKSENSILNNVNLKPIIDNPSTFTTTTTQNAKDLEIIDISGPASPPPEIIPIDIDQPVVIPTERRCSPILVDKDPGFTRRSDHHSKTDDKYDHHKRSSESNIQDSRQNVNNSGNNNNNNGSNKHNQGSNKHDDYRHHRHHNHSHYDSRKEGHNAKEHKPIPTHISSSNWRSNSLAKEDQTKKTFSASKPLITSQKLQNVKVIITEPLADHVKQKHFPSSNQFMPRASICHDNLKTLPQVNRAECTEAYSPEELWGEYNDSNRKNESSSSKLSVFNRLGEKIVEKSQTNTNKNPTSKTGRYTPIPDVLKSPPLSVSDINNLLLESGLEKDPTDISEIGSRRPPKVEDHQLKIDFSTSNTLEFARRKLAQTAKLYSPNSEAQKSPLSTDNALSSPLPNERIALKYNPHPRQERLQSVSSTDGSECSTQSKIIDPRIKSKLPASNPINPINVNVLPTINMNDPRLKKQNIMPSALTTNTHEKSGYVNPNLINFASKVDPRMSRVSNNPLSSSQIVPPYVRLSTNKPHNKCEEKWSTDSEENHRVKAKCDQIVEKRERPENSFDATRHCASKNISLNAMPNRRNSMNQSRFASASETEYVKPNPPKSDSDEDWDADLEKEKQKQKIRYGSVSDRNDALKSSQLENKQLSNSKNPNATAGIRNNFLPRPPNSDTEEDWDSEPEQPTTSKVVTKSNVSINATPNVPIHNNSAPELTTPVRMHVSPKAFVNILKTPLLPLPPQHTLQHSYGHIPHSIMAANNPLAMPTSPSSMRFNAVLNDKTEREKYFESKKQKPFQPRTYKEFREAKERQQAQAAALKKAAEAEAEAKKRAGEAAVKDNETNNAGEKKEIKTNVPPKMIETKVERKHNQIESAVKTSNLNKDHAKTLAPESTLDKMYRTQNFGTTFPKANTSFKIPKKKTEEKPKEETTNKIETQAAQKATEKDSLKDELKQESGKKLSAEKSTDLIKKAARDNCHIENTNNEVSLKIKETKDNQNKNSKHKQTNKEKTVPPADATDPKEEEDNNMSCKKSIRDPRCKSKNISNETSDEIEENENPKEENMGGLNDIIIKSSENEVVLKPQQRSENHEDKNKSALERFNEITKSLSPKPQRIMRRRNTMVAFESEPLVDKDKLRKANAMLFEDIQDEEKRKQKQKEEDRQNARRNRNLEEMFQKTDDNCTVSTQNIITGKRRTRATINFNETVNAMNVFKHTSKKGSTSTNSTSTTQPSLQTNNKNPRLNTKRAAKSSEMPEEENNKSIKDETEIVGKVQTENKETKTSHEAVDKSKSSEELNSSNDDGIKIKPIKTKLKLCIKLPKKRTPAYNPPPPLPAAISKEIKKETKFKPIQDEEHQNCAVSSTSTETPLEDQGVCSTSLNNSACSMKKETDDNEPTSTASKSNNPTPTPEASVQVLDEIVDKMLKPNADRVHILSLLGQILSDEKLELIKSLIENNSQQLDEQQDTNNEGDSNKPEMEENEEIDAAEEKPMAETNEQEEDNPEEKPTKRKKSLESAKKAQQITKKKRTELDRLNEDIRDMFICEGVLTATGRRMCTIMGQTNIKDSESSIQNKLSTPDSSPTVAANENENVVKKREQRIYHTDKNKMSTVRSLRRSVRGCKTSNEENEDDDNETTEESIDESNITSESTNTTDSNNKPLRKMPILKPNTPIKILEEEEEQIVENAKKVKNKRKSDAKCSILPQLKKVKITNKDNADSDCEKESEMGDQENENENAIKNTNIHWHNQSKFTTWCMICEKKIQAIFSGVHYNLHHGENYISRLAPVLLQQFKQGKLSKPLFGVDKSPKQSSWFFKCPFCLQYFNTTLPLWMEHFQNHTTEFRYECSKCHRGSNKAATTRRHLKHCGRGATMISSVVKLSMPTRINGHVCHLCNFLQLKRINLERHYIEQHNLDKNTIDLLGYTITLFDVENVEVVSEDKATQRENEAWESIEKDEQVIDIEDDDIDKDQTPTTSATEKTNAKTDENVSQCSKDVEVENEESFKSINDQTDTKENKINQEKLSSTEIDISKTFKTKEHLDNEAHEALKETSESANVNKNEIAKKIDTRPEESVERKKVQSENIESASETVVAVEANTNLNEKESSIIEYELINERETAQDIQDELLVLADKAAENNNESNEKADTQLNEQYVQPQTSISDIISSSIDRIYSRNTVSNSSTGISSSNNKRKSLEKDTTEAEKSFPNIISNVFMPTRDENNSSPTIQILAQSIINIEEQAQQSENPLKERVTISIAERLSQRFKDLQNSETPSITADTTSTIATTATKEKCKDNPFEKLINDTVLELEREKNALIPMDICETEVDKDNETSIEDHKAERSQKPETESDKEKIVARSEMITVISDDEDWEDIEITETAPVASAASSSGVQKSKSKGLFQKFGIFKANNSKSKKHIQPLVILPKKKTKEKTLSPATTSSSPPTTATKTNASTSTALTKSDAPITHANTPNIGFKPVVNIMDDLLPDSPCNDPIDLVPELAPLEPLQDLNDISSILDSNLSGALDSSVNINPSEHQASIEDALDFISEQQESNTQQLNTFNLKSFNPSQGKTIIHSMTHVGYSAHNSGENAFFKFYCLLQNCSFLYSSDSIGLETHFMCEHSQIKWDGYCSMCPTQCFPIVEGNEGGYPISKEIRHMIDKHVNKPNIELNTDSTTQHSTTSSQGSEEKPKIKLRRLTGDCLSRAALENMGDGSNPQTESVKPSVNTTGRMSMLGALLVAKPKPPTKEMPPQPQMPLTEPLLLDNNIVKNMSNDFLITSVTSAADTLEKSNPFQISSVISLQGSPSAMAVTPEQTHQLPTILNVRTLAPETANLWSQQQSETTDQELVESATDSFEVSQILANAGKPTLQRGTTRAMDDSPGPVVVAETVPLAQNKTGDFLITQTVSAQYNDFTSTAVGFNISIATAPSAVATANKDVLPVNSSIPITSRHYKCMANGCKFHSRVRVAMSDHLRFHERRNFSNKYDYFDCGFCSYHASDVDDYMKHTDQYHIINKSIGAAASVTSSTTNESYTATSLTRKIHDILNSTSGSSTPTQLQIQTTQVQDSQEVYLKKLKDTIDEIVGPTGLADDQLYRCVVKNCRIQLTESTFLNHIMFHISTTSTNPNNYIFKCPHCTAQYHRAAGIKAHIKNHARNRYFCYLCEHTSTNPGQLLKHFSEKHWHTLNMYTHELLKPKTSTDGSAEILDSAYYVVYTQELSEEEVRKFGEKLILEWQRKKSGSKTHFKSSEIELLPLSAIFKHEVNCGECQYKTKVRTNMYRHLQMHKQNRGLSNNSGVQKVCSVDPVNPVPCLNSNERFFDKMTNLASSSLVPSSSSASANSNNNIANSTKAAYKIPYKFIAESKRYSCGCPACNYLTISEDNFRTHICTLHSSVMSYRCAFCQEEICKRGIAIERIINHLRFHGATIYRCEECNYLHHLRYVVERHIKEKHATLKVNIIMHERLSEDNAEGTTKILKFIGKKYRVTMENSSLAQTSVNTALRSTNNDSSSTMSTGINNTAKGKGKWVCDVCGHRASNVSAIQSHCQQQHGVKNQYKCAHCNFGSQQLSQILYHIDEKHSGKTREARHMYHKSANSIEEVADTRPLWQRNDPTRIRHIRGILMEDEEESERYRKKMGITDDLDDDDDDDDEAEPPSRKADEEENTDQLDATNYIKGFEFGCFHCDFKTQVFEDLKTKHHTNVHNQNMEMAKPFWFRLHRRLCCPECRTFIGDYIELQQHIQNVHKKSRYYAADITMAENDDSSHRIQCGYCSFHCANVEHLYRHHMKTQHLPEDIRLDYDKQLSDILNLGQKEVSYQCSLCSEIFPNRMAIVQHACNVHAGDNFSFKELRNTCIYHCIACNFTSTEERVTLRHMIDHYRRFAVCQFCRQKQSSFNVYMQHCYAEHRTDIQKFKTIYTLMEFKKYLMKMYIIFPNGLVLTKRNLLNTTYGSIYIIEEIYEEMYKISQQPPIPRLSIARLVARKSIETQQKQHDPAPIAVHQAEVLEVMQSQSRVKTYSRRKSTVVGSQDEQKAATSLDENPTIVKSMPATIQKRRTTVYHENPTGVLNNTTTDLEAPLQSKKINKRRCTVAVDRDTLFSTNLSADSLLIERELLSKKRKMSSYTPPSCQYNNSDEPHLYPMNLDMEPFSFYGQKPETIDLSKIYTKVVIGGIKTPLTIDKFKLLFDIECQLKLHKCDDGINEMLTYKDYKHIRKACPASHKLKQINLS